MPGSTLYLLHVYVELMAETCGYERFKTTALCNEVRPSLPEERASPIQGGLAFGSHSGCPSVSSKSCRAHRPDRNGQNETPSLMMFCRRGYSGLPHSV